MEIKNKDQIKSISYKIEKYYIYGIYDNNNLVYIGYTKNIEKRAIEHLRSTNKILNDLAFKSMYDLDIRIIAIFYDKDLALEYEAILINRYKNDLLNKKDEKHRLRIK